jgi:hypothetical protein
MLENLREEATFEDDQPLLSDLPKPIRKRPPRGLDGTTGMSARQRFFLAAMFFMLSCLLGASFLVLAGKFFLPIVP